MDARDLKLVGVALSAIGPDNIVDNNRTDLSGHSNITKISTATPIQSSNLGTGVASVDA